MTVVLKVITWIDRTEQISCDIRNLACHGGKGRFSGYSSANSETRTSFSEFIYKKIMLITLLENLWMLTSYLLLCLLLFINLSSVGCSK